MFKRIIYDDWTTIVPEVSFWLTFGVFLAIVARAIFLSKSSIEHLESLPFEDDERPHSNAQDS